jgi:hypothetical protein
MEVVIMTTEPIPEAVSVLQSFLQDEDSDEHRETLAFLVEALDAERSPHEKIFPYSPLA